MIEVGGHLLGLPLVSIFVLHILGWACAAAAFAVLVERRFLPTALGTIACFLVACARPTWVWHAMSAVPVILLLNVLVVWRKPSSA